MPQLTLLLLIGVALLTGCSKAKLVNPKNLIAPQIKMVVPNIALFDKSTQIAVIGSGFVKGATVQLDRTECSNPQYVSETTLLCDSQPHSMGKVNVKVMNPNLREHELPNAFTYTDAVNPVPGFMIGSGGGVTRSSKRILQSSIGELGSPAIQKAGSRMVVTGMQSVR